MVARKRNHPLGVLGILNLDRICASGQVVGHSTGEFVVPTFWRFFFFLLPRPWTLHDSAERAWLLMMIFFLVSISFSCLGTH